MKRIKISDHDISWSSFRCSSREEQEKRMKEVENILNDLMFSKDHKEVQDIFKKYILESDGNKVRIRCFITFLSFNDRDGHIIRYSLEDSKIIARVLDSKTKEEICVKEGFYGWKPHRIYNRDVTNTLYRILYPAKKYHKTKIK